MWLSLILHIHVMFVMHLLTPYPSIITWSHQVSYRGLWTGFFVLILIPNCIHPKSISLSFFSFPLFGTQLWIFVSVTPKWYFLITPSVEWPNPQQTPLRSLTSPIIFILHRFQRTHCWLSYFCDKSLLTKPSLHILLNRSPLRFPFLSSNPRWRHWILFLFFSFY